MATRLKVGIVGCGLVAQVMHLHYLRELPELYEIVALCDVSPDLRDACARDYNLACTTGASRRKRGASPTSASRASPHWKRRWFPMSRITGCTSQGHCRMRCRQPSP